MDIIIGKTTDVRFDKQPSLPLKHGGELAVRVLHVRPARTRAKKFWQGRDRRNAEMNPDPVSGKVLVLLVPDGNRLPSDIAKGNYQIRLRIFSEKDGEPKPKSTEPLEKGFARRV
jgi:hypothetical protein